MVYTDRLRIHNKYCFTLRQPHYFCTEILIRWYVCITPFNNRTLQIFDVILRNWYIWFIDINLTTFFIPTHLRILHIKHLLCKCIPFNSWERSKYSMSYQEGPFLFLSKNKGFVYSISKQKLYEDSLQRVLKHYFGKISLC